MADEEKKDTPKDGDAESKGGGKGPLKLLAGIVILIALGGGVAMMAIPKKDKGPALYDGPWSLTFFDEAFVANTKDDNFSRYIKFTPSCNYFAYEQAYAETRKMDAGFTALLEGAFTDVVARYSLDEIMKDGSDEELRLAAQLELAAEPILFPVHIGDTAPALPLERDSASGVRPGNSHEFKGTFRGPFQEHKLHVDAPKKTVRLDEGEEYTFAGRETDFEVVGPDGGKIYLDLTGLKEDFAGEINVGVHGRIRSMQLGRKLAQ